MNHWNEHGLRSSHCQACSIIFFLSLYLSRKLTKSPSISVPNNGFMKLSFHHGWNTMTNKKMTMCLNAAYIVANIITFWWVNSIKETRTKQKVVYFQNSNQSFFKDNKSSDLSTLYWLFLKSSSSFDLLSYLQFHRRWLYPEDKMEAWRDKRLGLQFQKILVQI